MRHDDGVMKSDEKSSRLLGNSRYLLPFVLLVSLFFLWGMANNLNDILIKQFKKAFDLTDFQSGLVQSAFYFGYFLLAIPAATVTKKYSYKTGIMIGLVLYAGGAFLFYPAAETLTYGFFLFALFVIASGLAFLETSANPYVTELGPEEGSEKRLNFAQSFNPLGSIAGIVIGRIFIFSGVEYSDSQLSTMSSKAIETFRTTEAHAVKLPYVIIGCVVLVAAALIYFTSFPNGNKEESEGFKVDIFKSFKRLLKVKHFRSGVLAQFFYVGAQVGVWSFLIRYIQHSVPGTPEKQAADFLTISLVGFMIGRFASTSLLNYVKANRLMGIYAAINSGLVGLAITVNGIIGVWCLVGVSFFMSMMFPTIFALSVKKLGEDRQFGSSLVIMAIIGGAILPAVMGKMSDLASIQLAYAVPLVCFLYIIYYSLKGYKIKPREL